MQNMQLLKRNVTKMLLNIINKFRNIIKWNYKYINENNITYTQLKSFKYVIIKTYKCFKFFANIHILSFWLLLVLHDNSQYIVNTLLWPNLSYFLFQKIKYLCIKYSIFNIICFMIHWQISQNTFITIKCDIPFLYLFCIVSCGILMCHMKHIAYNFYAYNDVIQYNSIIIKSSVNLKLIIPSRYNYWTGWKFLMNKEIHIDKLLHISLLTYQL